MKHSDPWWERAACRGQWHLFFPDTRLSGSGDDAACLICATCPVIAQCDREWAKLPRRQKIHGIWAGKSWPRRLMDRRASNGEPEQG